MTLGEFLKRFPDDDAARDYLVGRRWPQGVRCPACGSDRIGDRRGAHRCYACRAEFSVRAGTVMERSKVPLRDWLLAIFTITDNPRVSSVHLGTLLGVTQKSSWYLLGRLRAAGLGQGDVPEPDQVDLDRAVDRLLAHRV